MKTRDVNKLAAHAGLQPQSDGKYPKELHRFVKLIEAALRRAAIQEQWLNAQKK